MQLKLFQDKKFLVIYRAKSFDIDGNYKKDSGGNFIYEVYEEIKLEPELKDFLDMLKITKARNITVFEQITNFLICGNLLSIYHFKFPLFL